MSAVKVILFPVLALSIAFLSTGCTDTSKDPMNKAKQDFACKDRGGVYSYQDVLYLKCNNGENEKYWRRVVLTPEYYPKTGQGDESSLH